MKRTTLFVPEQLLKRLRDLSSTLGISASEIIRRALEDFINKNKDAK